MGSKMSLDRESLQVWLNYLREFVRLYEWLANSFVLDHFVESHWDSLPESWREFMSNLSPADLSHWIVTGVSVSRQNGFPAPLALQSLRKCSEVLSLRRGFQGEKELKDSGVIGDKLLKLLSRHVKPKKQHEVRQMSNLIRDLAVQCNDVKNLVDIGSGLGHLCRFLSYGLGFNTIGIDADTTLGSNARALNEEIEKNLRKGKVALNDEDCVKNAEESGPLSDHISKYLEPSDKICHDQEFGLVGLHGCGDLGGIIVKNFVQNQQARFLAFASCCYMKLKECFPLSNFLKDNPIDLKYEALELSCHAKEVYMDRLRNPADVEKLKTHCYRATLETILVKHGLIKEGLRSVKNTHSMSFEEYAVKATQKLDVDITEDLVSMETEIRSMLNDWTKVVYFYTLRVMVAPVIETVVLLDRALFIIENGFSCELRPIFEPRISPRNLVLIGKK